MRRRSRIGHVLSIELPTGGAPLPGGFIAYRDWWQ